jgi:hypothetical protein
VICPHCHQLVLEPGKPYGYAGPICQCFWRAPPPPPLPTGWLCARCGTVHAPAIHRCTCRPEAPQ